jgi:hypothetical protein
VRVCSHLLPRQQASSSLHSLAMVCQRLNQRLTGGLGLLFDMP